MGSMSEDEYQEPLGSALGPITFPWWKKSVCLGSPTCKTKTSLFKFGGRFGG